MTSKNDIHSQQETNKSKKSSTAAIEGTSDCPGEPWDTSIPRISVGTFDTRGNEGACSTANIEFNPPSCMEVSRYGAPSDYQTLTTRYISKVTKN